MEWGTVLKQSIAYIEAHLLEDIRAEDVALAQSISPFYLQKGFRIMTGYSIGEYIRYRRLYSAALEVLSSSRKIVDIAYKYGYESPESFEKAFRRFHGVSSIQLRKEPMKMKVFLPLKLVLEVKGGSSMDVIIEHMESFNLIGFERLFESENSFTTVPAFWDTFHREYDAIRYDGKKPENALEQAVCRYGIGEYGICIDNLADKGKFRYMIAGRYTQGTVPEGMKVLELKAMDWAKFRCVGPMPKAMQAVSTGIYKEWLPGNATYDLTECIEVEWYSKERMSNLDYESAIWLPVSRKGK